MNSNTSLLFEAVINSPEYRDTVMRHAMDKLVIPTRSEMAGNKLSSLYDISQPTYAPATAIPTDRIYDTPKTTKEPSMATSNLSLYEVYITDRRFNDDVAGGVIVDHARAASGEDAKLKVILRNGYDESDIKFLDFEVYSRVAFVQPIDDDAKTADDE